MRLGMDSLASDTTALNDSSLTPSDSATALVVLRHVITSITIIQTKPHALFLFIFLRLETICYPSGP